METNPTAGCARSNRLLLVAAILCGVFLRLLYFNADRFHADEALYAGWALRTREDPLLIGVPVDKPPLYLYTLVASTRIWGSSEFALRLPNLAASTLGIALVYRLGRRLYSQATALWSAWFVALSPFDILFARTAFTDPMLVMWMLCALCAAAEGRWFWAGAGLGLALATKQHAVLLIPLVLAAGLIQNSQAGRSWTAAGRRWKAAGRNWRPAVAAMTGFALPYGATVAWDSVRWAQRPGYWTQSALSYGGLAWAPLARWGERAIEWLDWTRYLVGSPLLGVLLLGGCAALLIRGWKLGARTRKTQLDTLFVAYALGYLGLHTVLQFSIWDRYLLPLVPLVGLMLARTVCAAVRGAAVRGAAHNVLTAAMLLLAVWGGWQAAHNGYPVGGEHWAYQGLDQVATYLKQNAPPDAVLYHHWLRWHYTYYLHGTDFELRWWESGEHLRREAMRTPERAQYIVLPDWRTQEPDAEGIRLEPVYEARRQDGSVSLRVYRIELEPAAQRPAAQSAARTEASP